MSALSSTSSPRRRSPRASCGRCGSSDLRIAEDRRTPSRTRSGRSVRRWSPAKRSYGLWRRGKSSWTLSSCDSPGCSARFNDLQHVHPKDLIHTRRPRRSLQHESTATRSPLIAPLHGNPLVDYLGGLGKAVGIRGGIPGHGLLAPDGERTLQG